MKKRLFSIISLILIIAMTFGGCGGKVEEETTTSTTEVTTTEKVKPVYYNRLTGESGLSEAAVGKRPVAVMVNNIKASLPQYGIYDADIIFEILVEGGITRLMALYGDQTKVPKVCSVRSCRYYYPIFAHSFDAVYFCFGSNESLATPTLKRIGIDYFDGNQNPDSLVFGRDADRLKKYSSEHTAYVNGKNIPELLKKYEVRTDYLDSKDVNAFNFRSEDAPAAAGTIGADTVQLDYSIYYDSTFTYNSKTKTYYKDHCGKAHMDSQKDKQLNFTNVFVLETDVHNYKGGQLIELDWKGGTGFYISRGKAQKITWMKSTEDASIVVFDEAGNELQVNAGNSYIGVIAPGSTSISQKSAS
ncbi:MAG: DUF3048 domain-containing protein [Clostridia bacterium]|nr:DUF3048 domain-containing protein [Clostridia bacterium]